MNATIPNTSDPEDVTLDQAIALIAERIEKTGGKPPKKTKAAAKKSKAKAKAAAAETPDAAPKEKKKKAPKKKKAAATSEAPTAPESDAGTSGVTKTEPVQD